MKKLNPDGRTYQQEAIDLAFSAAPNIYPVRNLWASRVERLLLYDVANQRIL